MKLTWKSIVILSISLAVYSCNIYDLEDTILNGLENMDFECFDGSSEYYFRGSFGEDSICVYDGENSYKAYFGIGNGFVTLTPTFTLEEIQSQDSKSFIALGIQYESENGRITEAIRIKAQPMKFGTPLDSMVRAFLVTGLHQVRYKVNDDSISREGFEIILKKVYNNPKLNPDHWSIVYTSALGEQLSDSYLNILEISLNQNGDYIEGYIHLNFSCRMYHENAGDLTGKFARDLSGEFNLPIRYKL